jgi:hypothetical protein
MNETLSSRSSGDQKKRLALGYLLFLCYVIVAVPVVQPSTETGRHSVDAMEGLVWLIPFVVSIPWLSISTAVATRSRSITAAAVILLTLFLVFSALMYSSWGG